MIHHSDEVAGFCGGSCILDGEMMVWDPALDKYLGFGTLKTAAIGKLTFASRIPPSCNMGA